MNKNQIKVILTEGSFKEKVELISHLSDVFESYNKSIENFDDIVQLLIDFSIAFDDDKVTDEILEAICKAETYQDTSNINFDKIEEHLKTVTEKFIPRFIDILSYTHNSKYLPSILEFRDSKNAYIKQAVEDAIVEFG